MIATNQKQLKRQRMDAVVMALNAVLHIVDIRGGCMPLLPEESAQLQAAKAIALQAAFDGRGGKRVKGAKQP